ncbi:hypothetical protein EW146_g4537 [Bondarzewia mesenterica]|uniref:Uncharacterized protein n=1 Tax=Bondarzewia mesenterica TaxID=1095465 RepID=A0A4S4LUS1_9AGAM|nr:hypothetical protein EW146_g4537 [Bondarzewia mesenterica]
MNYRSKAGPSSSHVRGSASHNDASSANLTLSHNPTQSGKDVTEGEPSIIVTPSARAAPSRRSSFTTDLPSISGNAVVNTGDHEHSFPFDLVTGYFDELLIRKVNQSGKKSAIDYHSVVQATDLFSHFFSPPDQPPSFPAVETSTENNDVQQGSQLPPSTGRRRSAGYRRDPSTFVQGSSKDGSISLNPSQVSRVNHAALYGTSNPHLSVPSNSNRVQFEAVGSYLAHSLPTISTTPLTPSLPAHSQIYTSEQRLITPIDNDDRRLSPAYLSNPPSSSHSPDAVQSLEFTSLTRPPILEPSSPQALSPRPYSSRSAPINTINERGTSPAQLPTPAGLYSADALSPALDEALDTNTSRKRGLEVGEESDEEASGSRKKPKMDEKARIKDALRNRKARQSVKELRIQLSQLLKGESEDVEKIPERELLRRATNTIVTLRQERKFFQTMLAVSNEENRDLQKMLSRYTGRAC